MIAFADKRGSRSLNRLHAAETRHFQPIARMGTFVTDGLPEQGGAAEAFEGSLSASEGPEAGAADDSGDTEEGDPDRRRKIEPLKPERRTARRSQISEIHIRRDGAVNHMTSASNNTSCTVNGKKSNFLKKHAVQHASFDLMPDSAYIRLAQLVQSPKHPHIATPLPFSAPTLWRKVKAGTFPTPAKLSERVTAWNVGQVRAWLKAQAAL